jgi:hypothetical protein
LRWCGAIRHSMGASRSCCAIRHGSCRQLSGSGVELAEQTGTSDEVPAPDPQSIQERLEQYGLYRFVQTLPTLAPSYDDIHFDPACEDVKQFYLHVPVESLADLKLWTGLPNDHIDHTKYKNHLKQVKVPTLAAQVGPEILQVVEPQVITDAEHNLLFGYVDDQLLRNPFWMAVAHHLLERNSSIYILHLMDLVVQDGQTVRISNTPTAFFRKVTVYGSGLIDFHGDCKLIADTVEHIPTPILGGDDGGIVTTNPLER